MSTDLFSKQSLSYSEFRPHYPDSLFQFLGDHCGLQELAWDCATGNGQAAIGLAKVFKQVIATDLSDEQIHHAVPHPRIEYQVLPAEGTLKLQTSSVDLITVAQAIHWFDLNKFYEQANLLLKPDGLFATWAYGFHEPFHPDIDVILQRFYFQTLGPYWKENNKLIWNRYRDLHFPFQEIAAPEIEIQVSWSLDNLMGYFRSWSSTQLYREKNFVDPTLNLQNELMPHWGESSAHKYLKWKLIFRAGKKIS